MMSTSDRHSFEGIKTADFEYGWSPYRNSQLEYLADAQVQQVRGAYLAAYSASSSPKVSASTFSASLELIVPFLESSRGRDGIRT